MNQQHIYNKIGKRTDSLSAQTAPHIGTVLFRIAVLLALLLPLRSQAGPFDWTCLGGRADRRSVNVTAPDINDYTIRWAVWQDPNDPDIFINFQEATGPVVANGRVFALAQHLDPQHPGYPDCPASAGKVVCYDADDAELLWCRIVDKPANGSWTTPCYDTAHNQLLLAVSDKVYSFDAATGDTQWTTQLDKYVVNASPCVALDLPFARAFVTDYDGQGSHGELYCINLDPRRPENPYDPGQIVWRRTIGATSGNSPTYINGNVYVASITSPGVQWVPDNNSLAGTLHAFDVTSDNPVKLWQTTSSDFEGFFGGVTVTENGYLYAANWDFYGGENNSTLCKVDCNNGAIVWMTDTERTDSIPVVAGDRVYISGGIEGYGSRTKVTAYLDRGQTVEKLWETPPDMLVGGWNNQPVFADGKLYVGSCASYGYICGYSDLYVLDVSLDPADDGFVIDTFYAAGNSPAITHDSLYTLGPEGAVKFASLNLLGDLNDDGSADYLDIGRLCSNWLKTSPVGTCREDLNCDGLINISDFSLLFVD